MAEKDWDLRRTGEVRIDALLPLKRPKGLKSKELDLLSKILFPIAAIFFSQGYSVLQKDFLGKLLLILGVYTFTGAVLFILSKKTNKSIFFINGLSITAISVIYFLYWLTILLSS